MIVFDEHGGTYDHVPPPAAIPPEPSAPAGQMGFRFDRLRDRRRPERGSGRNPCPRDPAARRGGPTAGRYYIDISCGVPPKQFIRGEWFVTTAVLTGAVWVVCDAAGMGTWPAALISFAVGFTFRILALYRGWEEPLAKEPSGVHVHGDGRPLLGRKLAGKSEREMRDLDLDVENGQSSQRQ